MVEILLFSILNFVLYILIQSYYFHMMNKTHEADLNVISSAIYVKKSGVAIGRFKGKDLIPDHQFALSTVISGEVPRIEVDLQQALSFLKKEEVKLSGQAHGFALLTFKGFGIGWVKVLQNRVNNYLPKEWRILKSIEE